LNSILARSFSLAVVALVVVAFPLTALAHAQLEETSPADGEVVDVPPAEVAVYFNEPVSPPTGALRVFDNSGQRVDLGHVRQIDGGAGLEVDLEGGLTDNTYIATWRVESADGHPISGAFVFYVGEPGEAPDQSVVESLLGSSGDRTVAVLAGVLRWTAYVASLAAIGVFVFGARISRTSQGLLGRLLRVSCWVGILASLAQIPTHALLATGLGVDALLAGPVWTDAITSSVGVASLIRTAGFAAMLVASATWGWYWGLSSVLLLVAAEVATGHTRSTDPVWLAMSVDAVHVLTAAVWFGGIASLVIVVPSLRRSDEPVAAADAVARFSTVAGWVVLALGVTGLVLAWTQVRVAEATTSTPYGWTLITKIAAVLAVLGLAAYNRRALVPAIRGNGGSAESAWRRLHNTIRWELVGLAAVVGITAVLVNLEPAAEAAGVDGPYSVDLPLGDGLLNLVVDPNRAGLNTVHATVLNAAGMPGRFTGEVVFEFRLPERDLGPIVRRPRIAGLNHVLHTGPELAIPGTWEITVRHRSSDFEEEVAVAEVDVNG
jgi:copper transport protein